ncbi:ComEC/Rec2 family competence protein [Megasphaera massiliensis]|uniref:ComEC/Rec2 family competence protein n=2 Tax=Megasphaera massiliensis TaxID=1232428 RepID=UPI0025835C5A|nr:ComEC/Rec2 family competence protein [uncultured Megasphaera sp.]MBS6255761.1 ComEC/Rec2 family competence protein [Megasphaera sp.]
MTLPALRLIWLSLSLVLALSAGIAAADRLSLPLPWWGAFFLLALLGMGLGARYGRKAFFFFLIPVFFCLGAGRLQLASDSYDALPHQAAGADLVAIGTVSEKRGTFTSEAGPMGRYVLDVASYAYGDENRVYPGAGKAYVTVPDGPAVGETLQITGQSRPLTYYKNDGMYDARRRDREKSVWLRLFAKEGRDVRRLAEPTGFRAFLQDLRKALTRRYDAVLGADYGPVLSSLLFGGHYDELPPGLIESFSTTGLIHILSVSGSHVALLLAVLQIIGRAFGLRGTPLFILSAAFLLLYSALADFTSPVVRASIMGSLSAFSLTARRDYTAGHALALAVAAMLLYSPYLFFDLSFRLSCSASAGIVLFYKRIATGLSFLPEFLRNCLSVSLAAQVLVVPILFSAFFSFPVYSLLANAVVAPVLDGVMVLGLGASVLSLVYGAGADLILWGLKPFLALALKGNAFIAALPGSRLWAGQPSLWAWLTWYLLVAVVFFRPLRKTLFLPLIISLAISFMVRPSGPGVLIFDAGRDQATAIIYEDRSADLWYNKSRFSHPDQAAVVVIPALRANGIFTLRRCVVEGEERAYTEALFQKEFTFLKGPGTGDIPYGGARAVPKSFSDEALLWEFRSLDGWDGRAFPASAMATVVYEGRRGDGAFSEWSEAADSFGVPAYLPSRDGQLRLARRRGRWHLSTFVEEHL